MVPPVMVWPKRHAVQMPHAAEIEQAQDRADIEHVDQRAEHAEDKDLLPRSRWARRLALSRGTPPSSRPRQAEDLRDLDAGQILRQVGVDVRGRVLDLAVGPAGELAEDDREHDDERHKAEHHQRQLVVQRQIMADQDAEDDEACSWSAVTSRVP